MLRVTGERRATSLADFVGRRARVVDVNPKDLLEGRVGRRRDEPDPRPERSRRRRRARARFGTSAFDGFPALIVDHRKRDGSAGSGRGEARRARRWSRRPTRWTRTGHDARRALAESLAAVGGVRLSPVVAAVVERAMPVASWRAAAARLDFALFATDSEPRDESGYFLFFTKKMNEARGGGGSDRDGDTPKRTCHARITRRP